MGVLRSDGSTLFVEAALSAAIGDSGVWDVSLWDTGTWGPDVVWTDVTAWLRGDVALTTSRAFSRESAAYNSGQCSFTLDNQDGRFSPANMSSPYVSLGVTAVRPGRPVRVRAITPVSAGSVPFDLFVGFTDAWVEKRPSPWEATVDVSCVDVATLIAAFDSFATTEVGASEKSGARMRRVIVNARLDPGSHIAGGQATLQGTTLAANALTEVKLTADSEGGQFWVDASGSMRFDDFYAPAFAPDLSGYKFSDDDAATSLTYEEVSVDYSVDLVRNTVAYARKGSTVQTATDLTSRALYGDRQLSRTDLMNDNDPYVSGMVTRDVFLRKDPEHRISGLAFRPAMQPSAALTAKAWQLLAGTSAPLDLTAFMHVVNTPPGGYTLDRYVYVSGIRHALSQSDWVVSLTFSSATAWMTAGFGLWPDFAGLPVSGLSGLWSTSPTFDTTKWGW